MFFSFFVDKSYLNVYNKSVPGIIVLSEGSVIMATKSILKNITVKNNDSCRKLVSALENALHEPHKDVPITKKNIIVSDTAEIKKLFEQKT